MRQRNVVRSIYLYLVTVVGIVMALTGLIGTITNVLNMYVFRLVTTDSMQNEVATLLEFASAVAVGIPVWLYHWGIIQGARQHTPASPAPTPSPAPATEMAAPVPEARRDLIRRLYIYLLSAIGLFIVMFNLINVAPNIYRAFFMSVAPITVPVKPDGSTIQSVANTYAVQSLIRSIVAVVVGTPVWLYHWHLGQRENRELTGE
ncbi:MAG: DUF5671 domain-containing protein [Candidatus Cryosericum sp.]